MAVRVALLILVTGAFAAIWSGDHPDLAADGCPSERQDIDSYECPPEMAASQVDSDGFVRAASPEPADRFANVPLPDGISEGTFLIVDQFGRSMVRTVSMYEVAGGTVAEKSRSSDHYLVTMYGCRWHYIRIDQNAPTQMATLPSSDQSRR